MRGVPLPGQYASEVGAFAPAWAPGHTDSRVGLALLSSTHHVKLQSWTSITGLNWLAMHLCSVGHSLKNKSDIKGSIFLSWFPNVITSLIIQKSARHPWQIGAIFLFSLAFSFPFLWISQIPCNPEPGLQILNLMSSPCQYTDSSFHF